MMHDNNGNIRRELRTYKQLDAHYKSWATGHTPKLAIVGRGGIGKSHGYRSMLRQGAYHAFVGKTSAWKIYCDICDAPDFPIVFDDIGQLLKDSACIDLVKQLGDFTTHNRKRTIRWNTQSTGGDDGYPSSCVCTGGLLILLNTTGKTNADVDAILDRFDDVHFSPSKTEVINRMRSFDNADHEIIDVLADMPIMPSLRTYDLCLQWKRSPELDLCENLYSLVDVRLPKDVVEIMDILDNCPRGTWIREFAQRKGCSYEVAHTTWNRKKKQAEEIIAARKCTRIVK